MFKYWKRHFFHFFRMCSQLGTGSCRITILNTPQGWPVPSLRITVSIGGRPPQSLQIPTPSKISGITPRSNRVTRPSTTPSTTPSSSSTFRGRSRGSREFHPRRPKPNQGQPARTPIDKRLLITRSNFKGQSFSLLNIQTQASYLTGCLHLGLTSPGLRIRVRCMAARPDLTNVHQRFEEHIHQSERGAMNILLDHFSTAASLLKNQLHGTLSEMREFMDQASPSELICHQR